MCFKSPKEEKQFKSSIVVFLDILGFKSMIQSIGSNKDVKNVFDILTYLEAWNTQDGLNKFIEEKDFINEIYLQRKSVNFKQIQKEIRITYFSDSLVITLPYRGGEFQNKLFLTIRTIAYLCSKLAIANFFVRGGIAVGDMFHETNIFFGPAFLEAYKLESEIANYPRIILSKEILQLVSQSDIPYLKTDVDGLIHVDWVCFVKNNLDTDELKIINDNIMKNIVFYQNNMKVVAKYKWLKEQFK